MASKKPDSIGEVPVGEEEFKIGETTFQVVTTNSEIAMVEGKNSGEAAGKMKVAAVNNVISAVPLSGGGDGE